MKRGKTKVIVQILMMCFLLSACGNEKEDKNIESPSEEIVVEEKVEELSDYEKMILDASAKEVLSVWYDIMVVGGNGKLDVFIEELQDYSETNLFVKELTDLYKQLDYENLGIWYEDYINFLIALKCDSFCVGGNEKIINVWSVGMDDGKSIRSLIVEFENEVLLRETPFKYCSFTYGHARNDYDILYLKEKDLAFGSNLNSGTWSDASILYSLEDTPYKKIDNDEIDKINERSFDIIQLLEDCSNRVFKEYSEDEYNALLDRIKDASPEEISKKPAIGMTKDEVLNSSWGSPDKKNIDEYEWGTEEQWVYGGRGYIYFEDDIVTAIQHR